MEFVDAEKGGYTKAADLWSLGILTTTLLTGSSVVPRVELSQLSQVQLLDRLFGTPSAQWQNVAPRALRFLRGLLILNPDMRLTATEALNHSWFKKPLSEATLLEDRYERVIRFWRKRDDEQVIETLPSKVTVNQEDQMVKLAPKFRRKIPDATLSPYFGLDRHLLPRNPSKRKTILETLNESGSPFLPEQHRPKAVIAHSTARMRDAVGVLTVQASDLFGSTPLFPTTSQPEAGLDEMSFVPASALIRHSERPHASDMSDPAKAVPWPAASTRYEFGTSAVGTEKRKRLRRESEDPEERRIQDGVAKALPRYSTAKALKEAVDKKKEEMKGDNQLEQVANLSSSVSVV